MATWYDTLVGIHLAMLADLGRPLDRARSIALDFGCGDGQLVAAYRRAGFRAFGADIDEAALAKGDPEFLRPMRPPDYRLPFERRELRLRRFGSGPRARPGLSSGAR